MSERRLEAHRFRYVLAFVSLVACWFGSLLADVGFSDSAATGGFGSLPRGDGLPLWLMSVAVGVWGIHQLRLVRAWARSGGYVLMLALPAYVLARWLYALWR